MAFSPGVPAAQPPGRAGRRGSPRCSACRPRARFADERAAAQTEAALADATPVGVGLEVDSRQLGDPAARALDRVAPAIAVEHAVPARPSRAASTWWRARRPTRDGRPRARRAAPRPASVASRTGEISTGRCVASASACTNVGLSVMPPSTRTCGIVIPLSASAASTRSAPRCAMPSSTARTISARPVPRVRPKSAPRAP